MSLSSKIHGFSIIAFVRSARDERDGSASGLQADELHEWGSASSHGPYQSLVFTRMMDRRAKIAKASNAVLDPML